MVANCKVIADMAMGSCSIDTTRLCLGLIDKLVLMDLKVSMTPYSKRIKFFKFKL